MLHHVYLRFVPVSNIFLLLADLITCDLCSKCCVRRGHSMCPFFTFFSMKQLELNLAMLILNNVCGFHFVLSVMFWFVEIVKQNYIPINGIDMVGIVLSYFVYVMFCTLEAEIQDGYRRRTNLTETSYIGMHSKNNQHRTKF
jgi:hypothetical protein